MGCSFYLGDDLCDTITINQIHIRPYKDRWETCFDRRDI